MSTKSKLKRKIRKLTVEMLNNSKKPMLESIDKALNSGALDIDGWDENDNPMILPKIILKAVMENEAEQYSARGSSFEKGMKKVVNNLKLFL